MQNRKPLHGLLFFSLLLTGFWFSTACSPPDTPQPKLEFLAQPDDSSTTTVPDEPSIQEVLVDARQDGSTSPDTSNPLPEPVSDLVNDSGDVDFDAKPEPAPDWSPELPVEPGPSDAGVPDPAVHVGKSCSVNGVSGTCQFVTRCTGDNTPVAGHCPGPKTIQCCIPKPKQPPGSTCDPNKRPQPNSGLKEAPGKGGCLSGMVRVSTFCIDQFEASLVEILSNGSTRPWSPYFNPGLARVKAVSIRGAVPQGYISGIQAEKACKAAGKRLCTDTEWLRACRGTANTVYPYGNTRKPGVCNDARTIHPAVEYFKSSANWVFGKIQHACLNQLANGLAKSGTYKGCVTKEGVFDMMGNLHEWTSASSGTFRGGYYVDTYRNGNGCLYRTTAHNRQHWDYSTGFRCCADPKRP